MNNKDVIEQADSAFIERVMEKRERRQNEVRNKRIRITFLRNLTYAFQVLSVATAAYAIYYYAGDYSGLWVAVVWIAGLLILTVNEVGKRFAILRTAQGTYNVEDSAQRGWVFLVIATIALSMSVSYHGGSKFVQEENAGPALVHNAQIDSISQLIAAQEATKAQLATSKWKGALTRAARDGINQANTVIAQLMDEQRRLQKRDEYMNDALTSKHETKFAQFGVMFGGFSALLDILLLAFLFWAEKDETDIARYVLTGQRKKSTPAHAPAPHLKAVNASHDVRREAVLLSRLENLEKELSRAHAHTPAPPRAHTPPHARTHERAPAPTRTRTRARTRKEKKGKEGTGGAKVCKNCGTVHHGPRKKFCSEKCSIEYQAKHEN